MLYQQYKSKIEKISRVLKKIFKYRVPIIIALSLITASVSVMLSLRGVVVAGEMSVSEVEYGENFEYTASALLSKNVSYEYRAVGGEWSEVKPTKAGEYEVRAVSKRTFGAKSYGDAIKFKIKAKPLTVKPLAETIPYGDEPILVGDVAFKDEIICDEFTYSDMYAMQTEVTPVLGAVKIVNAKGEDVTDCYDIKTEGAEITYSKRPVTIIAGSLSREYDGSPLTCNEYTVEGGLFKGQQIENVSFDEYSTIINAGSVKNEISGVQIVAPDGGDYSENYEITFVSGELSVTPRKITVESISGEKEYDGTPLISEGVSVIEGSVTNGEKLIAKNYFDGAVDAITYRNIFDYSILGANDEDLTQNYSVTQVYGELKITKRPVAIKTATASFVYNGYKQCVEFGAEEAFRYDGAKPLIDGHRFDYTPTYVLSVKDSGAENNVFNNLRVLSSSGEDKTSNYDLTVKNGDLTVTPRPVTISSASGRFTYDGTPHSLSGNGGWNYDESTGGAVYYFVDGHIFNYTSTSRQNAGEETNVINDGYTVTFNDEDLTENYAVTIRNDGTLTVLPREVTVTAKEKSKVYDGTPLTFTEYDAECTNDYNGDDLNAAGFVLNHYLSVTESTAITNVNRVKNVFKEYTVACDDGSIDAKTLNGNYTITISDAPGMLEITKRPVTIKMDDGDKIFDGAPLIIPEYKCESDLNVVDGQILTITESSKATHVYRESNKRDDSKYNNILCYPNEMIKYTVKLDGNEYFDDGVQELLIADNYEFDFRPGKLTINPRPVKIKTNSGDFVYDGEEHLFKDYSETDISDGNFVNEVEYYNTHLNHHFVVKGSTKFLNVTRNDKYECIGVQNEYTDYYVYDYLDHDLTSDYDITFKYGIVTVIPREITVSTDDKTWTYDGDEHSYGKVTYNEEALVKTQYITPYGELPTIRYYSEGGVENRFAVKIWSGVTDFYPTDTDVTDNYNIALTYGTLKIGKRSLTLTACPIKIMYDGTRHVDDDLTYAEEGLDLVKTDVLTVKLTLKDEAGGLNVGIYDRNLEVVSIIDKFGVNVTECYETVCNGSTVEITPRPIKILTNSGTWTYDGIEHYDNGCTSPVQNDVYFGLAENQSAICDGDFVTVKYVWDTKTENNIFSVKIRSGVTDFYPTDTDVTDNYSITYEYGTLEITKRSITVTANSAEFEYDGQAHRCESFTPEEQNGIRGLVSTDEITAQTSCLGTDAGDYDNAILYDSVIITEIDGGKIVTDCYEIECVSGVMKITPRKIVVKTGSGTWVYDGTPHYNRDGYEITRPEGLSAPAIVDGQTFVVVSSTEITDAGSTPNEFKWSIDGGKKTNYEVVWDYGTLTVTQRRVVVITNDAEKVYDGTPLSCTGYKDYLYDDKDSDGFVLGHKLYVAKYSTITNVKVDKTTGEVLDVSNEFLEWQITDMYGNTTSPYGIFLENNYEIVDQVGRKVTDKISGGSLLVIKRRVIVTTQDGVWVYDGESHKNTEVLAVCDNDDNNNPTPFVLEHAFSPIVWSIITDVGSWKNVISKYTLIDGANILKGKALEDNYEIIMRNYGTLTVKQRKVRITTGNASKDYDGTPLSCTDYKDECTNDENSSIGFVLGHKLSNITSSSITDVGTTPNVFNSWIIVDADGKETNERGNVIAKNYILVDENGDKITVLNGGTLEITKRTITVVFENLEFIYDGQPHSASENDIISKAFKNGDLLPDRFTLVFDFETYTNSCVDNIRATVTVKENGKDVSDKYGVVIEGLITIKPREVLVYTESPTKFYDGTPLSNGDNTYSFESQDGIRGLLSGHTAVIISWNSITDCKDSRTPNGGKVFVEGNNGNGVTDNYYFTFTGTLTIIERKITVTTNDCEFTFNGYHQSDYSTPTVGDLVSGHSFKVLTSSSVKYVGDKNDNLITEWQVLDGDENDVTDNYYIVGMSCGTLTVKPRTVTLKVKDEKFSYSGKPRIQSELEFTGEDDLSGITIKALNDSLQTPQTKIGTYTIRFTGDLSKDIKFVEGETDITNCFKVEGVNNGTLTINLELVLRVKNLFINYNDCDRVTSDNYREKGGEYLVSYYDEDVGAYYGTIYEQGYKEIASALSFDCDRYYDFKAEDYEAILYILRQHPEYLTVVDKDGNVISDYTLTWSYDRNNKNTKSLYQGYIRIYHELEITTGSAEKEYDGTPLTCDKTTFKSLSDCGEVTKDLFNIKATGSQTEVGYTSNTLSCELVQAALDQGFIPDCFKIVNSDRCEGTLMVYEVCGYITTATKQSVYLKTLSYKEYDEKTKIPADSYDSLIDGKYSYDYLTSYLLGEKGVKLNRARIRFKNGVAYPYALPIYLKPQDSELQTSDAKYTRKSSIEPIDEDGFTAPYMVDFYNFDYLCYNGQLGANPKFNGAYTSFVRNNYLGLTSSGEDLTELLNTRVKNLQLDGLTDKEKIEKIVEYVKGLAPYNYNHYESHNNSVSDFLEGMYKSKGAVCRHYAAAATYLLRAAGFPARVTVGYRVNTKANVKTEIRSSYLHAWTEVYVDGVGWVSVDATASNGGVGGNGDGVPDEDGDIPDPNGDDTSGGDEDPEEMDFFEKLKTLDVLVRPKDAKKVHDGAPLTASEFEFVRRLTREDGTVYYEVDDELTQFFEKFYITGDAKYGGEQKEVGDGVSTITSFKLIYEGEDVIVSKDGTKTLEYGDELTRDMFNSFDTAKGVLTVLKSDVKDSTFVINLSANFSAVYDGTYKSIIGKPIRIKLKAAPIGVDSASVKIFTNLDEFNAYMANNSGGFAIYVPISDLKVKNVGETVDFKSLGVKIYKYDENGGWIDALNSYAVVFTDNVFKNSERKDIIDFIAANAPTGYGEVGSVYEKELITVNKATITFVFLDETIKFDGEKHSPKSYVVNSLPEGYKIAYLTGAFEEFTMAGVYESEIDVKFVTIYDAEGRDVTNNFEIVCKTGTFTIE